MTFRCIGSILPPDWLTGITRCSSHILYTVAFGQTSVLRLPSAPTRLLRHASPLVGSLAVPVMRGFTTTHVAESPPTFRPLGGTVLCSPRRAGFCPLPLSGRMAKQCFVAASHGELSHPFSGLMATQFFVSDLVGSAFVPTTFPAFSSSDAMSRSLLVTFNARIVTAFFLGLSVVHFIARLLPLPAFGSVGWLAVSFGSSSFRIILPPCDDIGCHRDLQTPLLYRSHSHMKCLGGLFSCRLFSLRALLCNLPLFSLTRSWLPGSARLCLFSSPSLRPCTFLFRTAMPPVPVAHNVSPVIHCTGPCQ